MKKTVFLFAVVIAIISSCSDSNTKANLTSDLDTLSYAVGVAQSKGFKEYLANNYHIDTTYMEEVLKGVSEGAYSSGDKKREARFAGIQIGHVIYTQMLKGANLDLFDTDSTKMLSLENILAGFICGVSNEKGLMTVEQASKYYKQKAEEFKSKNNVARSADQATDVVEQASPVAASENVQSAAPQPKPRQMESSKPKKYNWCCGRCCKLYRGSFPSSGNCPDGFRHDWRNLGEVGEDQYDCELCGITVFSKNKPEGGVCPQNNFSTRHEWH